MQLPLQVQIFSLNIALDAYYSNGYKTIEYCRFDRNDCFIIIHTYIYKFLIRGINGRSDNRETIKRNLLVNRGREGWFRDTSSLAMQKYVTRIKDQIKTGKLVIAKCIQCYTKYRICEIADVNIHYAVISRIAITLEKWNDSTFAYWSWTRTMRACAVSCPCLCASSKIFNFDEHKPILSKIYLNILVFFAI